MEKKNNKKGIGLFAQVVILFLCGSLGVGMFTYFTQELITETSVKNQTEKLARGNAEDLRKSIKEYPAYKWLAAYWYEHADELDMEYDAGFGKGTRTEEKIRLLNKHEPDFQIKYARTEDVQKLSAEDQKLYAEIVYAWMINRIDQIKQSCEVAFLFCVLTDETYKHQFFLMSGADPGAKRGTSFEDVYTLGVTADVAETQENGMRQARKNSEHLVDAGKYVDYYAYVDTINGMDMMIGLTYDLTDLQKSIASKTWRGTILAVVMELLLAWICLALIYRVVLDPIKRIQESIRLYMNNKESKEVEENLSEVSFKNEIGQLSADVVDMTKEIDAHVSHIEKITEEKERINAELSLATKIQDNMLPSIFPPFPDRQEFDLYASMEPAKEVGGDFYNFFLADDDHLCLLIADVSGKGIPAAMFMMASQIILQNNLSHSKSPSKALEDANNSICASNREDMFVTVWVAILDIRTGKLTAANAGHEYPAIKKKDGSFELFRDKHGMIIGGMEGLKYMEYEIQLEPGDRIFVYTDGVPEATDRNEEMFGTDRMIEALNRPAEDPQHVLANVREGVDEFIGDAEQFDDLTMLCLEYRG